MWIGGMVLGDDGEHGFVQQPIAGQNARSGDGQWPAAAGCHFPAGFLDKEAAGREIPGGKLVLEEGPEAAQPDIRQVERGCPHAADAVNVAVKEVADGGQGSLHHRAPIVIVAEADQDLVEPPIFGDSNVLTVVIGPFAAGRR